MKKTKRIAVLAACMVALLAACSNGSDSSDGPEPVGSDEPDSVLVEKVTLNETALTLPVRGTATLKATVEPDNADDKTVTWESSNEAFVTVDKNGNVTAVAVGTATITAKAGGKSATCTITVKSVVVNTVELEPTTLPLTVGETKELKVRILPAEANDVTVQWSSSNEAVATVDNGNVTAVKAGSATITAKAGDKSATCEVTVNIHTHYYVDWKCECGLDKPTLDGDKGTIDNWGKLTKYEGTETELVIPKGVSKIGSSAFEGCTGLTSVTIPDSVMSIGWNAFYGCTSLKEIQFTGTMAEWNAITGHTYAKVTVIRCSDGHIGVDKVPEYLKMSGTTVTGYTGTVPKDLAIPDGVTAISKDAFYNCADIESVSIPGSVTSIEDRGTSSYHGAFEKCTKLKTVTMDDGVKTIGSYAFSGYTSLASVTIPASVTSIGEYAFQDCTNLKEVTIPDGVTSIEENAFSGCTSLTKVTIPASVTSIEDNAFSGCTSLTKVTIPASVTNIGDSVFSTPLAEIEFTGTKAQWNAITGHTNANATVIRCSDGHIGVDKVPEYLKMSGTAVTGYTDGLPADLVIPDGVTAIYSYVFKDCTSLTGVTIPGSVTHILDFAFSGCTNLKTVAMNNGVKTIWENAFEKCTSLAEITIPDSVTSIREKAFSGCTSLTSVKYGGTKEQWEAITGTGKSDLKGKTITCTDGTVE